MTATASTPLEAGFSSFSAVEPWKSMSKVTVSNSTMIKLPKFWFKRWKDSSYEYIQISNKERTGFSIHPAFTHNNKTQDYIYVGAYLTSGSQTNQVSTSGATPLTTLTRGNWRSGARSKGTGWGLLDITTWSAIQMLYLVEFADSNSQIKLGHGRTTSSAIQTGSSDSIPNLTGGDSSGTVSVVYRGIEDVYGNYWQILDGLNISEANYWVCNVQNNYADSNYTSNYSRLSFSGSTSWSGGPWISTMGVDSSSWSSLILPSGASNGSQSTYWADTVTLASGDRGVNVGAATNNPGEYQSGFFSMRSPWSDAYQSNVSSRLIYIP